MCFSLVGRKIKTMQSILTILPFLSHDFPDLNFDILLFIFSFNLVESLNLHSILPLALFYRVTQKKTSCLTKHQTIAFCFIA